MTTTTTRSASPPALAGRLGRSQGGRALASLLIVLILLAAGAAGRADTGPIRASGIELRWLVEASRRPAGVKQPVMGLRLTNLDPVAYAVSVGTLEDQGSLQTRRLGDPVVATLPARSSVDLPIRLSAAVPDELSHSGMLVALLTACPAGQGRCLNGTSEPLFFHPEAGGLLVYGERVLCERFGCGDLRAKGGAEPGTWRVLGGGPLFDVGLHEEPDENDDGLVEGGD